MIKIKNMNNNNISIIVIFWLWSNITSVVRLNINQHRYHSLSPSTPFPLRDAPPPARATTAIATTSLLHHLLVFPASSHHLPDSLHHRYNQHQPAPPPPKIIYHLVLNLFPHERALISDSSKRESKLELIQSELHDCCYLGVLYQVPFRIPSHERWIYMFWQLADGMNSVRLHSQFSRTSLLLDKDKGKTSPKFGVLKCGTWQGLSSLNSLKNSCSRLAVQLNIKISLEESTHVQALVIKCNYPQNADFPRYYSKKQKKPFPVPILELRRAARERLKNSKNQPRGPVPPPKRGLLVGRLIPVAYKVFNARITLINNLKKLLKVMPVHACKWCNEIHVGPVGHPFKSCRGPHASSRKGDHEWGEAVTEDILVPVEAYHLYDRLGKPITHEERFSLPRIPAVVELCIQAGVDLPEYPTKRRRKPIVRIGKKEFVDADESKLPDPDPESPKPEILAEILEFEIVPSSSEEDTALLAEATLKAWEEMREGATRLMKMYALRACGYCPEVHVGPTGHKAQNCGAHKHQQRNGQHGWQAAVINDLIPPKYVWHVPDVNKPLKRELRDFYGQAPAVVELCVQAGASVPEHYKPTMRLDVGIPTDVREAEMVV